MSLDVFNSIREAEEKVGTDKIMKEAQERTRMEKEETKTEFNQELVSEVFEQIENENDLTNVDEVTVAIVRYIKPFRL